MLPNMEEDLGHHPRSDTKSEICYFCNVFLLLPFGRVAQIPRSSYISSFGYEVFSNHWIPYTDKESYAGFVSNCIRLGKKIIGCLERCAQ